MDLVQAFAAAAFLAIVANRLVDGLITPIFDRYELDKFWLKYIAWVVGGVLVFLGGVNLFADYFAQPLVGQVLSALVAGGGANMLHDLFDARQGEYDPGNWENEQRVG